MNLYGLIMTVFLSTSTGGVQTVIIPAENPDYLRLVEQGRAEYRSGHFVASERLFVAALGILDRGDEVHRAATLAELGNAYISEEELSKAERAYSESLAIYKRLSEKSNTVHLLHNLGATYSLEGRHDEAIRLLQQALKLAKTMPGTNTVLMADVLNALGMTYYRQGKIRKAEALFTQALQMISASGVRFNVEELINLGAVYIQKHKFQEAEGILKQALKVHETETGPAHPDLTFILVALGVLYTDSGRYVDAEEQFLRALKIVDTGELGLDTKIARILHALSATYIKAGRKTEAEAVLARAAVIARRNVSEHPDMVTIMEDYSTILNKHGKTKEANDLRVEARRARVTGGLVINAHSPQDDFLGKW